MRAVAGMVLACLLGAASARGEATITLRTEGGGFTDSTSASPVGGNAGTTLGAQRRIVVQHAVDQWAKRLNSATPIEIRALFAYFSCDSDGATIASATATEYLALPGDVTIRYPSALADKLVGHDLSPGRPDIDIDINADLDGDCRDRFGGFYYGLDGKGPVDRIDLVETILHELAHGLGFSSAIDPRSGYGFYDDSVTTYDQHVLDRDLNKPWSELTPTERRASAGNEGRVVWDGDAVAALAPSYLNVRPSSGLWGADSQSDVLLFTPRRVLLGSSVSHFDSTAWPDLLMEPYSSREIDHGLDLTVAALRDLGWGACCGDGVVDPGEDCDDGPQNDNEDDAPCRSDCRWSDCLRYAADAAVCPVPVMAETRPDAATAPPAPPVDAGMFAAWKPTPADTSEDGCALGGRSGGAWLLLALAWWSPRRRGRRGSHRCAT